MALDPAYFIDYPDLSRGDRVRYRKKASIGDEVTGTGTVKLIWLGIEEMCTINTDEGEQAEVTVCRRLGDVVERIDPVTTEELDAIKNKVSIDLHSSGASRGEAIDTFLDRLVDAGLTIVRQ